MELAGAEKRIQALFSELALEDRSRMPRFEHLWTRAKVTRPEPVRVVRRTALATAVVVIAAAGSFALWTIYKSTQSQIALNIAPVQIPTTGLPQVNQLALAVEPPRTPHAPRHKGIARQRQSESAAITEAALLSGWQSPTRSFMESPSSVSFNSLPQLDQAARDLESFLPKNDQLLKEPNQ